MRVIIETDLGEAIDTLELEDYSADKYGGAGPDLVEAINDALEDAGYHWTRDRYLDEDGDPA